jgi:hypothetical protein
MFSRMCDVRTTAGTASMCHRAVECEFTNISVVFCFWEAEVLLWYSRLRYQGFCVTCSLVNTLRASDICGGSVTSLLWTPASKSSVIVGSASWRSIHVSLNVVQRWLPFVVNLRSSLCSKSNPEQQKMETNGTFGGMRTGMEGALRKHPSALHPP